MKYHQLCNSATSAAQLGRPNMQKQAADLHHLLFPPGILVSDKVWTFSVKINDKFMAKFLDFICWCVSDTHDRAVLLFCRHCCTATQKMCFWPTKWKQLILYQLHLMHDVLTCIFNSTACGHETATYCSVDIFVQRRWRIFLKARKRLSRQISTK